MVRLHMEAVAILIAIGRLHLANANGKYIFWVLTKSIVAYADKIKARDSP